MKIRILILLSVMSLLGCADRDKEPEPTPEMPGRMEISRSSDPRYPSMHFTEGQIEAVRNSLYATHMTRTAAYADFMKTAREMLSADHHATEIIYVPQFYNEETSAAHSASKAGMLADNLTSYTCALAYMITGREEFARKAIYIFNAWASVNKSISSQHDSPLAAAYCMTGMLAAADLLMGQPLWSDSGKTSFRKWLTDVYLPTVSEIKNNTNNWGDWGGYATAAVYHLTGNDELFGTEITRIRNRIGTSVAADGNMPAEVIRGSNGLWYTYFALTPMCMSAQLALNRTGEDLFAYTPASGGTIKKALDYLFYYIQHKAEWPHYQMPAGSAQNGDWPVDLFEAMNDYYDDGYLDFVKAHRPVTGGYKSGEATHTSWFYPTLMRNEL